MVWITILILSEMFKKNLDYWKLLKFKKNGTNKEINKASHF